MADDNEGAGGPAAGEEHTSDMSADTAAGGSGGSDTQAAAEGVDTQAGTGGSSDSQPAAGGEDRIDASTHADGVTVEIHKEEPEAEPLKAAAPYEEGLRIDNTQGTALEPGESKPSPEEVADATAHGQIASGSGASVADSESRFADMVAEATHPLTQDDSTEAAREALDHRVAGAAVGPDATGVVRNARGQVVDAPDGSLDAAMHGVVRNVTTGEVISTNSPAPALPEGHSGPANAAVGQPAPPLQEQREEAESRIADR